MWGPIWVGWQKLNCGARAPWINIIVSYCCTLALLYAKMLKETEETIAFFVTFLSLVAFQLGGAGPPGPPWLRQWFRLHGCCLRYKLYTLFYQLHIGKVCSVLRPLGWYMKGLHWNSVLSG